MLTLLFLLSCGEATKRITNTPAASKQPNPVKEYNRAKSEELRQLLDSIHLGTDFMDDVRRLVSEGANPAQASEQGITALHHAVRKDDTEAIDLLLNSAVNKAELINLGDEGSLTPLIMALGYEKWDIAERLLKSCAPHEILALLMEPALLYKAEMVAPDFVAIMEAVLGDNFDALFAVIQDEKGGTVLHVAAEKGYSRLMEELLTKLSTKLSPEAMLHMLELQDSQGYTALEIAAQYKGILRKNILELEKAASN